MLDLSPNTSADGRRMRIISGSPQSKALGRKVSDEFTVPMCRGHHRELHRSGDEEAWWKSKDIDPAPAARALWLESHPLPGIDSGAASALECSQPQIRGEHITSKVV